jgi:hypothetical protein
MGNNLGESFQGAARTQIVRCGYVETLRILVRDIRVVEEAAILAFPPHAALRIFPGPDDIRTAVSVKHTGGAECSRRSRRDVVDEAHLPAFCHASQPAGAVGQQEFVGSDG